MAKSATLKKPAEKPATVKTTTDKLREGKPKSVALPPKGFRCQEASLLAKTKYIACGMPATRVVTWLGTPRNNSETYCMCTGCADHNVRNREARYVLVGESYEITPIKSGPDHVSKEAPAVEVEEAPAETTVTDEQRKSVADQCLEAKALEDEIAGEEAVTDEKRKRLRDMLDRVLPEAIKAIGVSEVPLLGGEKVKLKDIKGGYIKADNREEAHAKLEEYGEDAIIKRVATVEFGKGDQEWFEKWMRDNAKRKKPLNISLKEAVNAQTLDAWVRERLRTGQEIDRDLFGVYEITRAQIVRPKALKKKDDL